MSFIYALRIITNKFILFYKSAIKTIAALHLCVPLCL